MDGRCFSLVAWCVVFIASALSSCARSPSSDGKQDIVRAEVPNARGSAATEPGNDTRPAHLSNAPAASAAGLVPNGEDVRTKVVRFEWAPVQDADRYHLHVGLDPDLDKAGQFALTQVVFADTLSLELDLSAVHGVFASSRTIYWGIRPVFLDGNPSDGQWVGPASFRYLPPKGAAPSEAVRLKIDLAPEQVVADGVSTVDVTVLVLDEDGNPVEDEQVTFVTNGYSLDPSGAILGGSDRSQIGVSYEGLPSGGFILDGKKKHRSNLIEARTDRRGRAVATFVAPRWAEYMRPKPVEIGVRYHVSGGGNPYEKAVLWFLKPAPAGDLQRVAKGGLPASKSTIMCVFERTPCYGRCPTYEVELYSDGRVDFWGGSFVKSPGARRGKVGRETLKRIRELLDGIGAAAAERRTGHCGAVTDQRGVEITCRHQGRLLQVDHYHGDPCASPKLAPLEDEFDSLLGTAQWVGTPEETRSLPWHESSAHRFRDPGTISPKLLLLASCERGVEVPIREESNWGKQTLIEFDTASAPPLAAGQAGRILEWTSGDRMLAGGAFKIHKVVNPTLSNAFIDLPSIGSSRRAIICPAVMSPTPR